MIVQSFPSRPSRMMKIIPFFKYVFQRPEKSADPEKKLPPLKHILALTIWDQICTNVEIEPFEITNFDLGHPVVSLTK